MNLFQVPSTHIDQAWKDGAYNLRLACERTDEVTGDQLKMMLARGERTLLGVMHLGKPIGWCAVGIDQMPNKRALHVYAVWAPGAVVIDQLKQYAKDNGCSSLRGACDDAVARLWTRLGAQKKYQIMEWDI